MNEKKLADTVIRCLPRISSINRIESHITCVGIPDIEFFYNGYRANIELKIVDSVRSKLTLRATQKGWLKNRLKSGDRPLIIAYVVREKLFWVAPYCIDIVKKPIADILISFPVKYQGTVISNLIKESDYYLWRAIKSQLVCDWIYLERGEGDGILMSECAPNTKWMVDDEGEASMFKFCPTCSRPVYLIRDKDSKDEIARRK